ncbi:hypothetical protein H6F43_02785 [Leptolyngbya sp. FACHB-36]|uniref:hypothetical protein n=1 Tax=Leptolyngbya sp. FACHB-36 TaxID=2692808 RepID=UPI0016808296|nr:hypothetical protein [Leptolyngbya sp. FACHB-36]MBD2019110.1 hypothetical protein [Leptolyngbya sp. FACHB-36]
MTQPLLLKLAKQGDAIAIAALMNAALYAQRIRVRARRERGCLQVMLKSATPLNQHATIAFIRRGLLRLQAEPIESVRAYAWQVGQEFPEWITEFTLETIAEPSSATETQFNTAKRTSPISPFNQVTQPAPRSRELFKFGFMVIFSIVIYYVVLGV